MTYMDYRKRVEFGRDEYTQIAAFCKEKDIDWFASCWDEPSVDFIEEFKPVCYKKIGSPPPSLTDDRLLDIRVPRGDQSCSQRG